MDKGACISFQGCKYETKPSLIGFRVEIAYAPSSPETITVNYPGLEPFTANLVKIGAFCDKNPSLPVSMQETEAECSRMLSALEFETARRKWHLPSGCGTKDGGSHV